jgi:glycosyltransferase involved in cell wall biosynthesis
MSDMAKLDLTVVILAQNEAANLSQLLPTLSWAAEVIVLDHGSTDATAAVARQAKVCVIKVTGDNFASLRKQALGQIITQWLFYLDADERVPASLQQELKKKLAAQTSTQAFSLRRRNFCYGQELKHGGWEQDWVTRVFRRSALQGWQGAIHESPVYEGETSRLVAPLWHFTHQNTAANLVKSSQWTIKEAELLAADSSMPITKWTIWRKFWGEFYRRYYRGQGRRDGLVGFIESFTQACNRAWVYIQVWELQQQPSLPERYRALEQKAAGKKG